jgi:methionine synthase I (cobalamin-dependent)/5,10-methylenetetrahydrofolate reductase
MSPNDIQGFLEKRIIVFDGAMGTELYNRHHFVNVCFEELSVSKPGVVREIHEENKAAGADVLTTNSFGANRYKLGGFLLGDRVSEIAEAAARTAREAAGDSRYVAGSVGPLGRFIGDGGIPENDAVEAFREPIRGLAAGGADFIIFETFSRRRELLAAAKAATLEGVPYVPSMAFSELNMTRGGERLEEFYAPFPDGIDRPFMIGFNCGVGPREMFEYLKAFIAGAPYPVLVMPNAGYPQMVHDRMIYMTSPEYFAAYARRFAELGAKAVGGCCGTGPAHIEELSRSLKTLHRDREQPVVNLNTAGAVALEPVPQTEKSRFAAKLARGEWVTSVEIVPPLGYDLSKTVEKARACAEAGVDSINIPDGPRASSRVSPIVTALTIQRGAGIEAVLHVTCRDRNVIGMQSDLLGCASVGVNNLLIITGDPPKLGDYPFASAVFDIDSIGLTSIASRLNRGLDIGGKQVDPPTRFLIGVGADPTHPDQKRELSRFAKKVEAGAEFAITQPVYDPEVLLRFLEKISAYGIPVIAGVWPLASYQNALFLNNEVPGVSIPQAVMERMAAAPDKQSARETGIEISREIVERVRDAVQGIQVSAPFGNVKTALAVLSP